MVTCMSIKGNNESYNPNTHSYNYRPSNTG